jgi:uncharacterized protein (DUF433 family)
MGSKNQRTDTATTQLTVVRTSRGLSIAGTRITLYTILDYLNAEWPPKLIQAWFSLTDTQMGDVLAYIAAHRDEVEREYQQVLQQAEEIRRYWEERNSERLAQSTLTPLAPDQAALRAKLQAWKDKIDQASSRS